MEKIGVGDILRHVAIVLLIVSGFTFNLYAQRFKFTLPETFKEDSITHENNLTITDQPKDVIIQINFPRVIDTKKKTKLIFFALPNGNSIEWTAGKKISGNDDWHYDIQHIAAQTRFLRAMDNEKNIILIYLCTRQKSWPAWKKAYPDYAQRIPALIDSVSNILRF